MAFAKKFRMKEPLGETALYDYAVNALARKMRTVAELKRLMRTRVEAGAHGDAKMNAVVARLQEQKYLSDARYAADYTRMRQENEKFGKRRVQQDLIRHGVEKGLVVKTLDTAYEDVNEAELARRFIARKRLKQPANEKETARAMRMLVRAGFSTGTVFKVLRAWHVDDEALAALEHLSDENDEPEDAD
jgi:regulatory protein